MSAAAPDPYAALGVSPGVSDDELRRAYRRLVQRHHPDHNGGSPESARRFTEIQEAYARVRELRTDAETTRVRAAAAAPGSDPDLDARLAALERELAAARAVRERAERARRNAARAAGGAEDPSEADAPQRDRPSDEELGYYSTDDSFTRIFDDLTGEVAERVSESRRSPPARRLADWIDELGSRLSGEPPDRKP